MQVLCKLREGCHFSRRGGRQDFSRVVLRLRKPPEARLLMISDCLTTMTHLCQSALAAVTLTMTQHGGAVYNRIITPAGVSMLWHLHIENVQCICNDQSMQNV